MILKAHMIQPPLNMFPIVPPRLSTEAILTKEQEQRLEIKVESLQRVMEQFSRKKK